MKSSFFSFFDPHSRKINSGEGASYFLLNIVSDSTCSTSYIQYSWSIRDISFRYHPIIKTIGSFDKIRRLFSIFKDTKMHATVRISYIFVQIIFSIIEALSIMISKSSVIHEYS